MIYILLNSIGLILTGSLGRLLKGRIKDHQVDALYTVIGVIVLILGLQGVLETENFLVFILSLFAGTLIGSGLQLEERINARARKLMGQGASSFVDGIIAVVLTTCMGSMAIIGPLNIALKNDPSTMNLKTLIDSTAGLAFGSLYGKSVYPAALILFLYQAFFYLLGYLIAPVLTSQVVGQIGQIGSALLVLLSLNMLDLKEVKVMNSLPALIFPILFDLLAGFF